jgi:prepilin-type N-terminal cleavage/methylation domain-containing protein
MRQRHSLRPRACSQRGGFSLVEVAVTVAVLVVGAGMLAQTIVALGKVNDTNRETALAMQAVRNMLETLRSEPLEDVFALYNADPSDDPGGKGSAPGSHFTVDELSANEGATVSTGTIAFPSVNGELREDFVDAELGMPRDLNGDRDIDADDHSGDYGILPVRIQIDWSGRTGDRTLAIHTSLGEF